MKITYEHFFDASIGDVGSMFASDDFARTRGGASGATSSDVLVDGSAEDGFSVSIRRTVPATSIRSEFRSFVGSELDVRYTEVWEAEADGQRHGTFALEISGTPGHVAGSLLLTARDGGTSLAVDGTVQVRVPLVGAMIEKAVADATVKGLASEIAAADAWLADR